MSELVLNPSETRPVRPSSRRALRPLVVAALGVATLAGLAATASSVVGGLIAVPAQPGTAQRSVAEGMASSWPDLKDGLPALADGKAVPVPQKAEPPRVATLSAPPMPNVAPVAPPVTAQAAKPVPVVPTKRIPIPTEVAVNPPPASVKLLGPRETVRARDETPPASQEAARPREEAPRIREVSAEKHPASKPVAVAAATPAAAPEKARKPTPVVAQKPASHPAAQAKPPIATASAEPEETSILGVKVPSLAPAGRKIQESVTALGDAVKSVF